MRRLAIALCFASSFLPLHPQAGPASGAAKAALDAAKAESDYEKALGIIDKAVETIGKPSSSELLEEKATLLMLHMDYASAAAAYLEAAEGAVGLDAARLLCEASEAFMSVGLAPQAMAAAQRALAHAAKEDEGRGDALDAALLLAAIADYHAKPSSDEARESLEALATRLSAEAKSVELRALASFYALLCASGAAEKALPSHSYPFPIMLRVSGRLEAPPQAGTAIARETPPVSASPAPTQEATSSEAAYRYQVGAYSRAKNAEEVRDALRSKGFDARIVAANGLHKVIVHAGSKDAALQLRKAGFDSFPLPPAVQ
jgi:cell division septation protein DedD